MLASRRRLHQSQGGAVRAPSRFNELRDNRRLVLAGPDYAQPRRQQFAIGGESVPSWPAVDQLAVAEDASAKRGRNSDGGGVLHSSSLVLGPDATMLFEKAARGSADSLPNKSRQSKL